MSKILCGDAAEQLKTLPRESVNMCVTSPPYYGLRDYGEQGQIGIEQSPSEYIARLVKVFDEVYRVLAKDGTLWLNIGDSYAGSGKGPMTLSQNGKNKDVFDMHNRIYEVPKSWSGIKPKDMIGIPWMLAYALRDELLARKRERPPDKDLRAYIPTCEIASVLLRLQGDTRAVERGEQGTV